MKTLINVLGILACLSLLIFLVYSMEERRQKPTMSVSIKTDHSYLLGSDATFDMYVFFSNKSTVLTHIDAYDTLYLMAHQSPFKASIAIMDIRYSHREELEGTTYYAYVFTFSLPKLNRGYMLRDAYVDYTLKNEEVGTYEVGNLHMLDTHVNGDVDILGIQMISSKQSDFLQVEYTVNNPYDATIFLGLSSELYANMSLDVNQIIPGEQRLVLTIEKNTYDVFGLALVINYQVNGVEYALNHAHFLLYRDFEMLSKDLLTR